MAGHSRHITSQGAVISVHPLVNIGIRAARAAGNLIVRYVDRVDSLHVTSKAANDFVTEVDREAERIIIETIRRSYPTHGFLGEESGSHAGDESLWIIDPLDGTTNFLHGFPHFSVSLAVQQRGQIEHAIVFDPMRQEIFTASRGSGARLNDKRLRVVARKGLDGALLGTGFPFREGADVDAYLDTLRALMQGTAGIRRAGSAALDLAYVAAGRLDGFWEFGLSQWDIAAGALLVLESGGLVTDPRGADDWLKSGNILAASPRVHAQMLQTVRGVLPAGGRVAVTPAAE